MCSDCWALQSYRAKTALQRMCGAAAKSRSPRFNGGRHYLLRKTALQRIRGAISKPTLNMGQQQLPRKNSAAKNFRRSGAIAKPTLNMGQQQLPRKNSAAKNFRRSGAIAKPKIKHKSATITAQSNAAKNLRRNREVPNSMKVGIIYCAKLRCKEFAAQSRSQH